MYCTRNVDEVAWTSRTALTSRMCRTAATVDGDTMAVPVTEVAKTADVVVAVSMAVMTVMVELDSWRIARVQPPAHREAKTRV